MSLTIRSLSKQIIGISLVMSLFVLTGCEELFGDNEGKNSHKKVEISTVLFDSEQMLNEAVNDCKKYDAEFSIRTDDSLFYLDVADLEELDTHLQNETKDSRGKKWHTGRFPAFKTIPMCCHTKTRTWTRAYIRCKSTSIAWGAPNVLVTRNRVHVSDPQRCLGTL